jgi:hypothetical protein
VTFTATVTDGVAAVSEGTVTFTDGAVTLAAGVAVDGSGQATLTTSALTAGTHTITATYNGSPTLEPSFGTLDQVVDLPATVTTLDSSLNPSLLGDPVTFTATVTDDGGAVTDGTVTFTDGAVTLAANVALDGSGQATLTTSALTAGTHAITADYSGTAALGASSDTVSQVVDLPATVLDLVSNPNPSVAGELVTFTATVTSGGSPVSTGTVTFADGAATLGVVSVDGSGQATLATNALASGGHTITATYSGTATLGESLDTLDQVVGSTSTTIGTTVTTSPSVVDSVESDGDLPLTGIAAGQLMLSGLATVLVGAILLITSRRPRRD